MARSNMRDANWKSKPLHERKKLVKPLKPEFPLVEGEITCRSCGSLQTVQANAEVVLEFPKSKFWLGSAYCKGKIEITRDGKTTRETCGKLINGWVMVTQDDRR